MNTRNQQFAVRASVLAVQSALLIIAMQAQVHAAEAVDPAVAELVQPKSTVEIGAGYISNGDFKANEYTGLTHKGGFGVGNIDLRGGGAYDSSSAVRWRVTGRNLSTESQSLDLDYSVQGQVRLTAGFDELLRQRSDSYQTPLLGTGTNVLTLPSTWRIPTVPRLSGTSANARGLSPDVTSSNGLVSGVSTPPTAAQLATAAAIQAADLPSFRNVDLYTKRDKYNLGASFVISSLWELSTSLSHEQKQGMKPMGTVTRVTGGDISTIIPDLINQNTDQFNVALGYRHDELALQATYYGSRFTNLVPSMTWSNWALPSSSQTMSTAPSNQFDQFGLNGTYAFTKATKFAGSVSYGRNTQNESLLTAVYTPMVPVSSLQGLVVSKAMNLKLTSAEVKDVTLSAGYKFDQRDNKTPVHDYGFYDAGDAAAAGSSIFQSYFPGYTLASNANINANRAYSKKLNQLNLDADYRFAKGQLIKAGFEAQDIDRYCNGSWINCVDADKTKENTLKLDWRTTASDTIQARVGAAHSIRKVNYNENAWLGIVPAANLVPSTAPGTNSAYNTMLANGLTGYGPIAGLPTTPLTGDMAYYFANNNALSNALYANGNRISELPGMRRYNMADRNRDKIRSSIDWQTTEQISLQAGLDLNNDDYSHSVYGLQKAKSWALNLEGTLLASETLSVTTYVSHEDQRSRAAGNSYTANSTATAVNGATTIVGGCYATIALRNASNKIDPCENWNSNMQDKVDTLGVSLTKKGLASGKLDVTANAAYSLARSTNDVAGGSYVNNPFAGITGNSTSTIAAYYIAATALPVVTTRTLDLGVRGKYALNKDSAVHVGYRYQHMKSDDWMYDGLQFGGLAGGLPTNETAPHYTVNTVTVAYMFTF